MPNEAQLIAVESYKWAASVADQFDEDEHYEYDHEERKVELTPEGVHQYGGGYTEYVARTGHEAPGLHPGG